MVAELWSKVLPAGRAAKAIDVFNVLPALPAGWTGMPGHWRCAGCGAERFFGSCNITGEGGRSGVCCVVCAVYVGGLVVTRHAWGGQAWRWRWLFGGKRRKDSFRFVDWVKVQFVNAAGTDVRLLAVDFLRQQLVAPKITWIVAGRCWHIPHRALLHIAVSWWWLAGG